ncbi:IS110 family transposase, partial [Peribacillus simplex]|uniref:IS110 family transposase n=1 Tax=Peribacillus simplex TaxID=1478 RepID=UPI003D2BBB67
DVAKGESQVQAFLDQSKPYGKSFSMKHIKEELDHFLEFLKEIEEVTGQMPMVILESTGHYHSPVIQYLEEQGIPYILLNPIISYQAKKSSLRKVKTDAIDAYQLCVLYYKEDIEPHKIRGIQLLDLRNLSRQQEIEYKIIQSIPGIGEKIAATIISEIGEIDRFNHPKKLVAFAGVDPSVHSSGKFTATINRITKRGSSRLRHSLYLAVLCGIRSSRNKKLKAFYDKKKSEGKPAKVSIVACMNKLLHWIYALLKRKEAFLDLA